MITLGYVVSPFILSRLDCRPHFVFFILIIASSTLTMGLSILFPTLSFLSLPSLVLVGSVYGLGVGPVPFVLMSTLFPQKYKSIGLATSQIARALAVCLQLKVIFIISSVLIILLLPGFPLPSELPGNGRDFLHPQCYLCPWGCLCFPDDPNHQEQVNI